MRPRWLLPFPSLSWRWAVAAVVAGAALAGCGSSSPSTTTTTQGTTTTSAPSTTSTSTTTTVAPITTTTTAPATTTTTIVVRTCVPAQLTAIAGVTQGSAGHLGRLYQLQNSSSATCTLGGYPGLALLDASSKPLPTTVVRNSGFVLHTVTLVPGGSAYFTATWADATGYAGASCPTSAFLAITPPNDTTHVVVSGPGGTIQAFGGTVSRLQCGTITVTPVSASSTA